MRARAEILWERPLLPHALLPLALLYGGVVRMRRGFYAKGILLSRSLPCKVLSVGNLTVGGSGKTPMTASIAQGLKDRGHRVAILSRGYKGRREGIGGVVSDGERILLEVRDSGDEAQMLARRLKGIPVGVGKDRYRMGLQLWRSFQPKVIVLDDGFQHLRLRRDLDLLVVDSSFRPSGARLLPAGPLREPLEASKAADIIVITYWDPRRPAEGLERTLRTLCPSAPLFHASASYEGFVDLSSGEVLPLEALRGRKVCAISGTAKPRRFFEVLRDLGLEVFGEVAREDHHLWREEELEKIMELPGIEAVVTTEKDAVRVPSSPHPIPIYSLRMGMKVLEEGFWDSIEDRIFGGKA